MKRFGSRRRYRIEISEDGESNWKLATDQTQTTSTSKERTDLVQTNSPRGRFVRVTFAETPDAKAAALAELEFAGNLATQ